MTLVRRPSTRPAGPEDRAVFAAAFVTPHAVARYRAKVDRVHQNQVVQDITDGLRSRAATVRDRGSTVPGAPLRVDVDVEPPGHRWVARIVHDPDRGKLVVETILDHRDDWQVWPPPDAAVAAVPAGGLWLSRLTLDTGQDWVAAAVRDVCTMHRRILDLVEHHPQVDGARPLWAQPARGLLLVRSTEPVDTTPPGFATAVTHRVWHRPDRPGLWVMTGQINPARNSKSRGEQQRKGKGRGRSMVLLKQPGEVADWVADRLPGADLVDLRITGKAMRQGRHHVGKVHERVLTVTALVRVHQPDELAVRARAGLGRGKAWGCGLTLWDRAVDELTEQALLGGMSR